MLYICFYDLLFGSQAGAQSTELHQPGLWFTFLSKRIDDSIGSCSISGSYDVRLY